ncbi:MAG TPA: hypothetical protein VNO56_04285 [Gaiellaceae bacterium]|nr:hypothetical protein [Gaiellaceae bacterium]
MGKPRHFGWGVRPRRRAVLAVALLAASLVLAEGAGAQAVAPSAPASGALMVPLGQVAQQSSQTAQAAVAQATAAQVQPTNVAVPVTAESPAGRTVVVQANTAGAGASAANRSSTTQDAGQSRGGRAAPVSPSAGTAGGLAPEPASGGPAQASGQASRTAQSAGAQATTVQAAPINIAIPVVVGSPGASIVIVQTNTASSAATAGNWSSTMQTSGQAAAGSGAELAGQPGTAAPVAPGATAVGPGPRAVSVLAPTGSGTAWNWNWIWDWTIDVTFPSVQRPAFPWWALPGAEARTAVPARAERRRPASARRAAPISTWTTAAPGLDVAAAPAETADGVSSSIVQRPKAASEPALKPLAALPPSPLPAPSAGSGFVPAGLLLGALGLLALYLGSLGLLFGRLSLASAPWRHQAYLAPLQRPG